MTWAFIILVLHFGAREAEPKQHWHCLLFPIYFVQADKIQFIWNVNCSIHISLKPENIFIFNNSIIAYFWIIDKWIGEKVMSHGIISWCFFCEVSIANRKPSVHLHLPNQFNECNRHLPIYTAKKNRACLKEHIYLSIYYIYILRMRLVCSCVYIFIGVWIIFSIATHFWIDHFTTKKVRKIHAISELFL